MPHYVTKLWEKFLLPCTIYLLERQTSGIQKLLERWEGVATGNENFILPLNSCD